MAKIPINIDGKALEVDTGKTILDVSSEINLSNPLNNEPPPAITIP